MSDASVRAIDGRAVVTVGGSELLAPLVAAATSSRDLAAGSAAGAAADAGKSAQSAALSQTAALTAPNVYADEASGRAGVADGRTFWTDLGAAGLGLYRRTSSSASTLISKIITGAMLASSSGAALIGYGSGRTVDAKLRETVSPQDFGAKGDGFASPTEHVGFEAALTAIRNPNDAFFSKALTIPTGVYFFTAPIDLPQSENRIFGSPHALLRGAAGEHILRADGASFVTSKIQCLSLYGGVDGIHGGTTGEIAQLSLDQLYIAAFTGTGLYFTAGLTSAHLTKVVINGILSTSGHAVHCGGGANNNNVIGDCDFYNLAGDVVRVEDQANAWQVRNVHIEGRGQAAAAQYHFEAPIACHILGGWSEASHEFLVRTTPQVDPRGAGVMIDGLTSIGSNYGGSGFVGSKFDTGKNRIILGSNYWAEQTIAPAQCFIYGVNQNLRTNASTVWTRDTGASFQLTSVCNQSPGATRTLTLTFNRPNDTAPATNQQVASARVRVLFGAFTPAGTAVHGAIEWHITVRGFGVSIPVPIITKVTENDGYSAAGATAACVSGTPGATEVSLTITVAGLLANQPGFLQAEIEGTSSSYVEADRFVLSVA